MAKKVEIKVYLIDGRVFTYECKKEQLREHAHAIVTTGWRNVVDGTMEYYPVWQIRKVTFPDQGDELSKKYEGR